MYIPVDVLWLSLFLHFSVICLLNPSLVLFSLITNALMLVYFKKADSKLVRMAKVKKKSRKKSRRCLVFKFICPKGHSSKQISDKVSKGKYLPVNMYIYSKSVPKLRQISKFAVFFNNCHKFRKSLFNKKHRKSVRDQSTPALISSDNEDSEDDHCFQS